MESWNDGTISCFLGRRWGNRSALSCPGVVWLQRIAWWLLPGGSPCSSLLCFPAPVPCFWPVLSLVWIGGAPLLPPQTLRPRYLVVSQSTRKSSQPYLHADCMLSFTFQEKGQVGVRGSRDINFVMITMIIVLWWKKAINLELGNLTWLLPHLSGTFHLTLYLPVGPLHRQGGRTMWPLSWPPAFSFSSSKPVFTTARRVYPKIKSTSQLPTSASQLPWPSAVISNQQSIRHCLTVVEFPLVCLWWNLESKGNVVNFPMKLSLFET